MGRPVGSVLELSIRGDANGQTCLTILHYRVTTTSTFAPDAEAQEFLAAVNTGGADDILTSYRACCSEDYVVRELRAQFVSDTRYAYERLLVTSAGTRAFPCPSQNVSAVLVKRTELAGRANIGTIHMPGLSSEDYDGGFITGAQIARLDNLGEVLDDMVVPTLGGGEYRPVIYHRQSMGSPDYTNITSIVSKDTVRVMRRRTVGLGI